MTVAFLGLTGVQGVLPHHYTEHILARAQAKDFTHGGVLGPVQSPTSCRCFTAPGRSIVSRCGFNWRPRNRKPMSLRSICSIGSGWGRPDLRGRMSLRDSALLRYAGLLGQKPASAVVARAIVRDYFGVEVEIEQFMGAWYPLDEADQCDLASEQLNNKLGEGAIAGDAVWDPQARFRVRLGSTAASEVPGFSAGREGCSRAAGSGSISCRAGFTIRPAVGPAGATKCRGAVWETRRPRGRGLGWCGWLKTELFTEDAGDAVFAMN